MNPSRRALIGSVFAAASTFSTEQLKVPAVHTNRRRCVTKDELWSACAEHIRWRRDPSSGARLNFSERDLSGLEFPEANSAGMPNPEKLDFLCLNGCDFSNADLSFCKGGAIAFATSSFQTAVLSHSAFTSPRFANSSLWFATCTHIEWGVSDDARHNDTASFIDVTATRANFAGAKVRGMFHRVSFIAADLRKSDFSHSIFAGSCIASIGHETQFGAADLSSAKLCHTIIEDAAFTRANLDQTDFYAARIAPRIKRDIYDNHPTLWPTIRELADA